MSSKAGTARLKFRRSYSFKLFITFSAIMTVALVFTTIVSTREISRQMLAQELSLNELVVTQTAEYIDDKLASARKVVQDLYFADTETKEVVAGILTGDTSGASIAERIADYERLESLFMSALHNDEDIVSITVIGYGAGQSFSFSKEMVSMKVEPSEHSSPWTNEAIEKQGPLILLPSTEWSVDRRPTYSIVARVYDHIKTEEIGVISITFDATKTIDAYRIYSEKFKGRILAIDYDGEVIFDSRAEYYGEPYPEFDRLKSWTPEASDDAGDVITVSDSNHMLIASITSKGEILRDINTLRLKSYLILLSAIAIIIVIYYNASWLLSRRITQIEHAMEKVQTGDLAARIPTGKLEDELSIIAQLFNAMCEQLSTYIEKSYVAEIRLKETELMALQTQINPHFIYNTLEVIRVKALVSDNHDVADMIILLSDLFRRSLRDDGMVVSVNDEMSYCRAYFDLNSIRFHERMSVEYKIDEGILEHGIPKLVLQPIVENIVVHGVDMESDMIRIKVVAGSADDDVVITVSDTGKGIASDAMAEIHNALENETIVLRGSHIGLRNVNDRLRIMFGSEYGLTVDSVEGIHTTVTIRFPALGILEMRNLITKKSAAPNV